MILVLMCVHVYIFISLWKKLFFILLNINVI